MSIYDYALGAALAGLCLSVGIIISIPACIAARLEDRKQDQERWK